MPIWPGLLGSMIAWSLVALPILVLAAAPGALLRLSRRVRGRCIRCGYQVRQIQSEQCPECGWTVGGRLPVLRTSRLLTTAALALLATSAAAAVAWHGRRSFPGPDPIHIAARHGDTARLQQLLVGGIDPDHPTGDWLQGATPLMWAAAHGHLEVMELLIAAGADVNHQSTWNSPLRAAAGHGQADAVALLLEAGAQPETQGGIEWLLELVTRSGHTGVVRVLLASGENTGAHAHRALTSAAEAGHLELMRVLIDAGADVNGSASGRLHDTPLRAAVAAGQREAVELLIDAGADPLITTDDGRSLIFTVDSAPADIRRELLEILTRAGLDIDRPCSAGNTALIEAVYRQDESMVRALLAAGADPRVTDRAGRSPLDFAEQPIQPDGLGMVRDEVPPRKESIAEMIREAL